MPATATQPTKYDAAIAAVPNAKITKLTGSEAKAFARAAAKSKAKPAAKAKAKKTPKVDKALRPKDHVATKADVKDLRPRDAKAEGDFKALTVACPTCASKRGAPCMERGKNPGIRNAHGARVKAAEAKAK